jgi:hypothetical protein
MPVMQNCNGWLVLHDRDTVNIIIHISSIQEVAKHYVEERGRSYLCYGDDCDFCNAGMPRRNRYVAQIIFHGETLKWEFSQELYRVIRRLTLKKDGSVKFTVMRSGRGKQTRYRIYVTGKSQSSPSFNEYQSGRYGHLVQS